MARPSKLTQKEKSQIKEMALKGVKIIHISRLMKVPLRTIYGQLNRLPEYEKKRSEVRVKNGGRPINKIARKFARDRKLFKSFEIPVPRIIMKEDIEVGPAVYALISATGEFLYVGTCLKRITRPLDSSVFRSLYPDRKKAYNECNYINIYKCSSERQMKALEIKLMVKYRPKFNKEVDCDSLHGINIHALDNC